MSILEVVSAITGKTYTDEALARLDCVDFLQPITSDGIAQLTKQDEYHHGLKKAARIAYPLYHERGDFLHRLALCTYGIAQGCDWSQERGFILGPEPGKQSLRVSYLLPPQPSAAPAPPVESLIQLLTCCVCLEIMNNPTTLDCGHSGCMKCTEAALTRQQCCPSCRALTAANRKLTTSISLNNIIMEFFPKPAAPLEIDQLKLCQTGSIDVVATQALLADAYKLQPTTDLSHNNTIAILRCGEESAFAFCSYKEVVTAFDSNVYTAYGSKAVFSVNRLALDKLFSSHPVYHVQYTENVDTLNAATTESANGNHDEHLGLPATLLSHFLSKLRCEPGQQSNRWRVLSQSYDAFCDRFRTHSDRSSHDGTNNTQHFLPFRSKEDFDVLFSVDNMKRIFRKAGCVFESMEAINCLKSAARKYLDSIAKRTVCIAKYFGTRVISSEVVFSSMQQDSSFTVPVGYGGRFGMTYWILKLLKRIHPNSFLDDISASVVEDIIFTLTGNILHQAASIADEGTFFKTKTILTTSWPKDQSGNGSKMSYEVYKDNAVYGAPFHEETTAVGRFQSAITSRCIEAVVKIFFKGEMVRLALEAAAASSKFQEYKNSFDWKTFVFMCGSKFKLTTGALVDLTAVVEQVIAELLEVAGNVARKFNLSIITPRCLKLAIDGDAELSDLLKGLCIRDGGVSAFLHPLLAEAPNYEVGSIDLVKEHLLSVASTHGSCIEPFSGHFVSCSSEESLVRCDVLDALADLSLKQRQVHMLAKLPEHIRIEAEAEAMDPLREWHRRLADVNHEQQSVSHVFDLELFHAALSAVSTPVALPTDVSINFTAEAVDAIMTLTEDFLVKEARLALRFTLMANRKVVLPQDFEAASMLLSGHQASGV